VELNPFRKLIIPIASTVDGIYVSYNFISLASQNSGTELLSRVHQLCPFYPVFQVFLKLLQFRTVIISSV